LRAQLHESFDVLHFNGHGTFAENEEQGYLALEDEYGEPYLCNGELLVSYLVGSSVRLAVLAACETATASPRQRFSSIAQKLMGSGDLLAVVAMQYAITDTSAIAFIGGFYKALASRRLVDWAMVEGRRAILEQPNFSGNALAAPDWATPVLYVREGEGYLFSLQITTEDKLPSARKIESPQDIPTLPGPLLGRDAEFNQAWSTLRQGGRLLLCGMGGIGKTVLAEALVKKHLESTSAPVFG
jgi:hypothetical protein